jgi:type VI secretion system protein ImpA
MRRIDELIQPVSPKNPSGVKLKGLPILTKISEARRQEDAELLEKLQQGDSSSAKKADWEQVRELTEQVLITQSKDLQIAVWLVEAMIYLEQISGLTQGLNFLHALLEKFWESLYPELEDGSPDLRVKPLSWLGNYLNAAYSSSPALAVRRIKNDWISFENRKAVSVSDWKATKKEFYKARVEDFSECEGALERLEAFCNEERFPDERPSFTALSLELQSVGTALREKLQGEFAVDANPPSANARRPAELVKAPARVEHAAEEGSEPALRITSRAEAIAQVAAAARFLQSVDPQDPIGYLLLRAWRWGELRGANDGELSDLLEPPPQDVRKDIKRLAQAEAWASLLEAAEVSMCSAYGRAWLDLQRYAIKACDALGYAATGRALRSELRILLADFADLVHKTLLDDTGTANPETLAWLRQENLVG